MADCTSRFDEMRRLQRALEMEFGAFQQYSRSSDPCFFEIVHRKIFESLPLRAYVTYKLFQYLREEGGKAQGVPKRFFMLQLPLIMEIVISLQYYHNQILDGKDGVDSPQAVNNNLVSGNLLRSQLFRYIRGLAIPGMVKEKLLESIYQILDMVDIGQRMEEHCNRFENWQSERKIQGSFEKSTQSFIEKECIEEALCITYSYIDIPEGKKAFLRSYFERIFLTNASLYKEMSRFLKDVMGVEAPIEQFCIRFGLFHQIVNDVGDLVPSQFGFGTAGKSCKDAFCDLKNHNITLPLAIHLLRNGDGEIARFLQDPEWKFSLFFENVFYNELVRNLSVYYAMSIGKQIKKAALKWLGRDNPAYKKLEDTCLISDVNQYYMVFYQEKRWYKKYKKQCKNKTLYCPG